MDTTQNISVTDNVIFDPDTLVSDIDMNFGRNTTKNDAEHTLAASLKSWGADSLDFMEALEDLPASSNEVSASEIVVEG